jgi:hypothetical protein
LSVGSTRGDTDTRGTIGTGWASVAGIALWSFGPDLALDALDSLDTLDALNPLDALLALLSDE